MRFVGLVGLVALLVASPALASPGVGDPVYGATVEKGSTEIEQRYGRLAGGPADGEDRLVYEVEHAFTPSFSAAALLETSRAPGESRRVDAFAVEGVYALARIRPLNLDTAVYAEFKHGLHGDPDAIEVKGLFEHRPGGFDGRLNLISEQPLHSGEPLQFGYAASADWRVLDELRLGLAAFGDLGTTRHFGGREEHYVGPEAKLEVEHVGPGEFEIEAGWLRAFGAARDMTQGQARLLIAYQAKF